VYATAANHILTLKVRKVSIIPDQLVSIINPEKVPGAQQAGSLSRLSAAFPDELVDGHVHVIVVPPSGACFIRLFALVQDI
jgi:hypothetical protein